MSTRYTASNIAFGSTPDSDAMSYSICDKGFSSVSSNLGRMCVRIFCIQLNSPSVKFSFAHSAGFFSLKRNSSGAHSVIQYHAHVQRRRKRSSCSLFMSGREAITASISPEAVCSILHKWRKGTWYAIDSGMPSFTCESS